MKTKISASRKIFHIKLVKIYIYTVYWIVFSRHRIIHRPVEYLMVRWFLLYLSCEKCIIFLFRPWVRFCYCCLVLFSSSIVHNKRVVVVVRCLWGGGGAAAVWCTYKRTNVHSHITQRTIPNTLSLYAIEMYLFLFMFTVWFIEWQNISRGNGKIQISRAR